MKCKTLKKTITKYVLLLSVMFFLLPGCCFLKDLNCQECRVVNKRLKSELIYNNDTQSAYLYNNEPFISISRTIDDILMHQHCWQGMEMVKLKKIFPFLFEQGQEGLKVYCRKKYFDCSIDIDPTTCSDLRHSGLKYFMIKVKTKDTIEKMYILRQDKLPEISLIIE